MSYLFSSLVSAKYRSDLINSSYDLLRTSVMCPKVGTDEFCRKTSRFFFFNPIRMQEGVVVLPSNLFFKKWIDYIKTDLRKFDFVADDDMLVR